MANDNRQRLEKLLSRGRWYFVLVRGVLFFGVGTAVLLTAWEYWQEGKPFLESLIERLPVFLLSGIFFGLFLWYHLNRQYKRFFNR